MTQDNDMILVPRVASKEMLIAAWSEGGLTTEHSICIAEIIAAKIWQAMLQAYEKEGKENDAL